MTISLRNASRFCLLLGLLSLYAACKRKEGCTDAAALNYDSEAKIANGACLYDADVQAQNERLQSGAGNIAALLREDLYLLAMGLYESCNNDFMRSADILPACATISIDSTPGLGMYPAVLYIDFGASGCYCPDGRVRKGRLEYYINNSWRSPSGYDSMRITPVDYRVSNQTVSGVRLYVKRNGIGAFDNQTLPVDYWIDAAERSTVSGTYSYNYRGFLEWNLAAGNDFGDDQVRLQIHQGLMHNPALDRFGFSSQAGNPLTAYYACLDSCLFKRGELRIENTYTESVSLGDVSGNIGVFNVGTLGTGNGTCNNQVRLRRIAQGLRLDNQTLLYSDTSEVDLQCSDFIRID